MSQSRKFRRYAGSLPVLAAGLALPLQAQSIFMGNAPSSMDSFGGDPTKSSFIRVPKDTDDWTRHFRLGAMVGLNISANFSMKGNFGVSGDNPAAGIFDNGYIQKDSTGSTVATSNWGYNGAGQYNATKNQLTFLGTSSFAASDTGSEDAGYPVGMDMAYGDNLWYWKHARVGWELGFGWLPMDISEHFSAPASVSTSTYVFSTESPSGPITIPEAPYQGSASGYGPLIPYPPNFNPAGSPSISTGTVSGTHTLDLSLYTLRLGPSFYWDLSQRFGMSLGVGPAVGLADGDYNYNETVSVGGTTAQNNGRISSLDVVYGGYANGSIMYHLQSNGDIYLSAQYMPMTDAKFSGGGREGDLHLSGQVYISLGINWPF